MVSAFITHGIAVYAWAQVMIVSGNFQIDVFVLMVLWRFLLIGLNMACFTADAWLVKRRIKLIVVIVAGLTTSLYYWLYRSDTTAYIGPEVCTWWSCSQRLRSVRLAAMFHMIAFHCKIIGGYATGHEFAILRPSFTLAIAQTRRVMVRSSEEVRNQTEPSSTQHSPLGQSAIQTHEPP